MQITVVLFPRFSNLCLANTLEPLRAANDLSGDALFRWQLAAMEEGPVTSSSGIEIQTSTALSEARGDLLIVLPSYGFQTAATARTRAALRAASLRFKILAGFDMGAWLLADAGLLDGYRATLHRDEIEAFAERFPAVDTLQDPYVRDRDRLTCAGGAAALEPMLDLVAMQGNAALRLDVALLFHAPGVAGRPGAPTATSRQVARVLDLMGQHLEEPLPLPTLAERAGLSLRGLDRLTREKLSTSPAALYRRLRLLKARRLVQDGDMAVTEIALRTGYTNASAMTRAFRREFGSSPRALRGQ
ncbi:MAG: helix-turn-helix domain-containing protein [Pseudomonadota bacterium]